MEEQIRLAYTPGDAYKLGQTRTSRRADWYSVKEAVMKEALMAKFTQHKDLNSALLATQGKKLVEHTRNDSYWGDGGDGSGKNRLGHLLMEVRDELLAMGDATETGEPKQRKRGSRGKRNKNKTATADEPQVDDGFPVAQ